MSSIHSVGHESRLPVATDADDFNALIPALLPELRRHALRTCGSRHLAEDVVQETLLRAWRHRGRLRDRGAARGWLHTILRNERNRMFSRRYPETSELDLDSIASPVPIDVAAESGLYEAVAGLADAYRRPLELFAFEGCEIAEISRTLGLTGATVRTRLFRARAKLRAALCVEAP